MHTLEVPKLEFQSIVTAPVLGVGVTFQAQSQMRLQSLYKSTTYTMTSSLHLVHYSSKGEPFGIWNYAREPSC